MTEKVKDELKIFEVAYVCDNCGLAEMALTGIFYPSDPPQWPHKCPSCGTEKALNEKYPKVEYRRA